MQSHDFVEGVSGWRMSQGKLELYGGRYPVILDKLDEPEPKPFIVVGGVTCISQAEVERANIGGGWKVKTELLNGKHVATGIDIGAGLESQFLVDADRFAVGGSVEGSPKPGDALKAGGLASMLDAMASTISETSLGKELSTSIKIKGVADQVRDVLRAELKPGGMLYRS